MTDQHQLFIGADPGEHGGIVCVCLYSNTVRIVHAFSWNERGDTYNQDFILSVQPTRVMIEDVPIIPGKSSQYSFKRQIENKCAVEQYLDHLDCESVQPRSWQSVLGLNPKVTLTKRQRLQMNQLYVKGKTGRLLTHEGQIDAACIALASIKYKAPGSY